MKMNDDMIFSKLIDIVGSENVFIDAEAKNKYGKDLTQCYTPNPLAAKNFDNE